MQLRSSVVVMAVVCAGVAGVLASCGENADVATNPEGDGGSGGSAADASVGGSGGGVNIGGNGGAKDSGCEGAAYIDAGPACGDGKIDPGEACDDANGESGDGCGALCDAIEKDWACPTPGEPCVYTVVCGDGKIGGAETCDDHNKNANDGCDPSCKVEQGWECPNPGVACVAAECGDGFLAGKEKCDDGDVDPLDGCAADCTLEKGFKCPIPNQPCEPTTCGDGVAEGTEQCDDGDNDMGDGCTPFCVKEPNCSAGACTSTCGDGLKLPSDNEQCEDGNTTAGDGCSPTCQIEPGFQCTDVTSAPTQLDLPIVLRDFHTSHPDMEKFLGTDLGIVDTLLKANGKPKYKNTGSTTPTTTGEANFDQWYSDVANVNFTVLQTMTLLPIAGGAFQFNDSTFFPLNGIGFGNEGNGNNFHFTSEVRYWFEYKGGEQLDFTGDDDVWVFVKKQLAVDIGGVHGAQNGSVTLDAAKAAQFGLVVGEVYEIVVFQAERHTTQSNYRLTLSGFTNKTSNCQSHCGDGIQTPDEACDDGVNDGSYGSCTVDCKPGPHCGDGIEQTPEEECDDGVNLTPYGGCAPGCKDGAFCGDGNVDSTFGEACDDGVPNGGSGEYGKCAPGCLLGPRCGDGVLQSDKEACDDGNKVGGDGCSASCKKEGPA